MKPLKTTRIRKRHLHTRESDVHSVMVEECPGKTVVTIKANEMWPAEVHFVRRVTELILWVKARWPPKWIAGKRKPPRQKSTLLIPLLYTFGGLVFECERWCTLRIVIILLGFRFYDGGEPSGWTYSRFCHRRPFYKNILTKKKKKGILLMDSSFYQLRYTIMYALNQIIRL